MDRYLHCTVLSFPKKNLQKKNVMYANERFNRVSLMREGGILDTPIMEKSITKWGEQLIVPCDHNTISKCFPINDCVADHQRV